MKIKNRQAKESAVAVTESFVKAQFMENPHFSFGDWRVMFDHSLKTKELAEKISKHIKDIDKEVTLIGALLHDIGKTYHADEQILHTKHESFNLRICEKFIDQLLLSKDKIKKIKEVVSYNSKSDEMKIIKDADAIALYSDKRLYMLFIEWAVKNNLDQAIKRKIDKYDKLNFEISRNIARPLLENMKKDWDIYKRQDIDK